MILQKIAFEEAGSAAGYGDHGAAGFDPAVAGGGAVFEGMADNADGGGEFGALDFVRQDFHAGGHANSTRDLKDGLGEVGIVLDGGGAAGEDDSADEVLGESAGLDMLPDFGEEFFGAFVDDDVQVGAVHDGRRPGDVGAEFDAGAVVVGFVAFAVIFVELFADTGLRDAVFEDEFVGFFEADLQTGGDVAGDVVSAPFEAVGAEDAEVTVHGEAGDAAAEIEDADAEFHILGSEAAEGGGDGHEDHIFEFAALRFDARDDVVLDDGGEPREMYARFEDLSADADGIDDAHVVDIPFLRADRRCDAFAGGENIARGDIAGFHHVRVFDNIPFDAAGPFADERFDFFAVDAAEGGGDTGAGFFFGEVQRALER